MSKRTWTTLLVVIADPFANEQPAFTKAVALARSIDTHPVIGTTAERVIDRVACDLLVIKPASVTLRTSAIPQDVHAARVSYSRAVRASGSTGPR